MRAKLGVRRFRSRAKPHFPIQIRRHWLRSGISGKRRFFWKNDFNPLQLANAPVPNELGHPMIHRQGAVLRARLKYATLLADCFDQDFAFIDRQRGFFALHILAGARGHNADQRMPMIRRGDHDRVDVLAIEDFAKVFGRRAVFGIVRGIDERFGFAHPEAIDIANRKHPGIGQFEISIKIPGRAVIPGANEADGYFFARSIRAQKASGDEGRH